jgi:hypothetical protein
MISSPDYRKMLYLCASDGARPPSGRPKRVSRACTRAIRQPPGPARFADENVELSVAAKGPIMETLSASE